MGKAQVVTLPGLEKYSNKDLNSLRAESLAFARYEKLLQDPQIDPLHRARHEAWMVCAAATMFKTKSTAEVCRFWSDTADEVLQKAWRDSGLNDQPAALFALGKHGAQELNLSSDIDLLVVAEPKTALDIERRLRTFQARLQTSGPHGFCYRLDFDLRPGGKIGPLLTSPSQFQDYYWSQGETWERLALIRLRPLVGPTALIASIEDLAQRYSFRKFLDYTLLEDLKALRSQVHQFGFTRKEHEVHIKLEVGGIRDIELFVHSLLVMNGGKIPALRTRSTTIAIEELARQKILNADDAAELINSYWMFRHLENFAQMIDDRQTHFIKGAAIEQAEPAMIKVDKIVSGLLGAVDLAASHLPATTEAQRAWLENLGFSDSAIQNTWQALMRATALSHKNDRDERARQEFLFKFIEELARSSSADRDLGLGILEDFVRATRAKATFFTMLLRTPGLIKDLARLFCMSPYLGSILAARPELLDHFILRQDEPWSADLAQLLEQMNDRKLLTEIWSANQFLDTRDLNALFSRITLTADDICLELLKHLRSEFPKSHVEILALGKWGGMELGVRSDLDFIFVTEDAPSEDDFKVARRFISRLSDPQKGGHLYEVDLRLRPSGQSGPLLVARDQLLRYWRESAQAWERQAYLRARPLQPTNLDKKLLAERGLTESDHEELKRIREKLFIKPQPDSLDIKYCPGGMLDVEFTVQTAILAGRIFDAGCSTGEMIARLAPDWGHRGARLGQIYMALREHEQILQLATANKLKTVDRQRESFAKAAQLMGASVEDLWARLLTLLEESITILNLVDPIGAARSTSFTESKY